MYRDDFEAAVHRASALERELSEERARRQTAVRRLNVLEAEVEELRAEVGRPGRPVRRAEGTTILVLGILSLVLFPLLGPVAWIAGSRELRAIDAGEADPAERGKVSAGRTMGIAATVVMVLGIVVATWLVWFAARLFEALGHAISL